jgi:methylthioribose-1-phosphate isomerase
MKMRGAPLLGAAAAFGLALSAYHSKAKSKKQLIEELEASAETLRKTRPTAVNLFWAIERVLAKTKKAEGNMEDLVEATIKEAQTIADNDVEINKKIGRNGSALIKNEYTVLTHCNAGSLATVDYGTALGVVRSAWEDGKRFVVFATETRPLLQGARLTAYELKRDGISVTLITDSMVGFMMEKSLIDLVIVGADRIVRDAVINKIGTLSIAVLAKEFDVPFYVAAPISTMDLDHVSKDITIEERDPKEVTHIRGRRIAARDIKVRNPAFDITPMKYIQGIITEREIVSPETLRRPKKMIES